jgi:AcrR family transcriptional regulator
MGDGGPALSDAEFVDRVRRGLARYDRLRGPLLALYLGLAVGFVALVIAAAEFIRGAAWPGLGPGFAVGLALGTSLGLLAVKIAHGLVGALCGVGRAERLLVRHYDAARRFGGERADEERHAEPGAAADRRGMSAFPDV